MKIIYLAVNVHIGIRARILDYFEICANLKVYSLALESSPFLRSYRKPMCSFVCLTISSFIYFCKTGKIILSGDGKVFESRELWRNDERRRHRNSKILLYNKKGGKNRKSTVVRVFQGVCTTKLSS